MSSSGFGAGLIGSGISGLVTRRKMKRQQRDYTKNRRREYQYQKKFFNEVTLPETKRQEERQDRAITRAADDAREAGLHPLFALGGGISSGGGGMVTPPAYTPSTPPGQSVTGSMAGDVVARSIDSAQERKQRSPLIEAQTEVANSRAARNHAEAMYYTSLAKRAEQASNASGEGVGNPIANDQANPIIPPPRVDSVPHGGTAKPPGGGTWEFGDSTPAERFEQEYGDIGGSIYGLGRYVTDYIANWGKYFKSFGDTSGVSEGARNPRKLYRPNQ